jgi:TetR/AcrR family tetracycline transcriptional repressor
VLEGAIELLDEVGLDELSTRKLASRLGVHAGALYWHFPTNRR